MGSPELLARLKDGMTLESGAAGTFDLKNGTVRTCCQIPVIASFRRWQPVRRAARAFPLN